MQRVIGILLGVALLAACAGTATRLPEIGLPDLQAEAQTQEARALKAQDAYAERLLNVGHPVLLANADLCPKTRLDLGIMIHSRDSYPKEMRAAASRELAADEAPSVYKVVPDGPADRAGLQVGDRILLDDKPATAKALRQWLTDQIEEELSLRVARKGRVENLQLTPDQVCASRLRLRSSAVINAYADGRRITVTTGLMDFVRDDNELALIIGHELAHNTMGHIRKVVGNYILSGFATRYTRPFESEADYVGLYYMVRAGYDPSGVEDFWRRLAEVDPRSVNRAKTHPTFPDRYLRLAATRAEIEAKQAMGEPLIPNFKTGTEIQRDGPDA